MIIQEKILTSLECREIVEQFSNTPLHSPHDSKTESYKYRGAVIKNANINLYEPKFSKVLTLLQERLKKFGVIKIPTNTLFIEYTKGCYQDLHKDDYTSIVGSKPIRSLSLILSEEGSYNGGTLIVEDQEIDKEIGTLAFFPSNTVHQVTEVTSGKRLVLVMFLRQENLQIKSGLI